MEAINKPPLLQGMLETFNTGNKNTGQIVLKFFHKLLHIELFLIKM